MCEILLAVTLAVFPQSFESGGWKLDCQFMDQIGSPYLLAHGIGFGSPAGGRRLQVRCGHAGGRRDLLPCVDTPLNYGDYYFLEALMRVLDQQKAFRQTTTKTNTKEEVRK